MRPSTLALVANLLLVGQSQVRPAQPVAALSPYIDVHAHLEADTAEASIQAARQAMKSENAAKILFLPAPYTAEDAARVDSEVIAAAEKKSPGVFAFLGGGGTLNATIQEAMRSGNAGGEVQRKFRERAEEIVRQGAVGFGEMTAEHFAGGTPYQYAPADHPLFLLLADIAAQHRVVIDLHMEAVPQTMKLPSDLKSPPNRSELHDNIAAFERLLAHNPRASLVWAHAGSDNTGYRTPELCRRLLGAHANLYMQIKVDPLSPGKNYPLDAASGRIKPEWLQLFRDFPDRFVIGSDQHYLMPPTGPQRWQEAVLLLNQLPGDLRRKIGTENAQRIYRLQ
jgi:predicted TIM-barrel fold metal-dependent hydrolase